MQATVYSAVAHARETTDAYTSDARRAGSTMWRCYNAQRDERRSSTRTMTTLILGPNHPLLRPPQRCVLQLDGEHVRDIEYRDTTPDSDPGAVMIGYPVVAASARMIAAARVTPAAHALAFCAAVETALVRAVPPAAAHLRLVLLECERALAHLGNAAQMLMAIGLDHDAATLRDCVTNLDTSLAAGTGFAAVTIVPGGIEYVPDDTLLRTVTVIQPRVYRVAERLIVARGVLARTVGIGVLRPEAVVQFGTSGPLARASGDAEDLRTADVRYSEYGFQRATQPGGDVHARLVVLLLEAVEALRLVDQMLRRAEVIPPVAALTVASGAGSAVVESAYGPLGWTVAIEQGLVTRATPQLPRALDRLLARTLLVDAYVDDTIAILASACAPPPLWDLVS